MSRSLFLHRPGERGTIFIYALVGSLFLFALVVPLMWRLSGLYRITEKNFFSLAALNLAEAGVERAIWELNQGDITTWEGDVLSRQLTLTGVQATNGDLIGDVEIVVTSPASDNPIVQTTGRVPWYGGQTVSRSVRVILKHGFQSIFNFGIFGDEGFDIHGDAYTDSYDSFLGPYNPLNPGDSGDVGTNAGERWDIVLLNNTVVNGDVMSGFESDPEVVIRLSNNALIMGDKSALNAPKLLPVFPPPVLTERGALSIPTETYNAVITESGRYTSLSLAANSKLTINGNVTLFIDGNFSMSSNTTIEISPGSEVEIFLGNGTFTMDANSLINNLNQDPRKLAILGTESFHNMVLRSNADFYGVIYVPEATVDYAAAADTYGSIISNYFSMSSNGGIHYDEFLGEWEKYLVILTTYVVKSWQETY